MSLRNGFVLLLALSTIMFLAACGSSSSTPTAEAPPTGGFSNSSLNGTYVFSISGQDLNGYSYAALGTFTANGSGGITGGSIDMNDAEFAGESVAPLTDSTVSNNGFYSVGVDGRGQATLGVPADPFASGTNDHVVLDFVLQSSSQGLVTEFDGNATGSGTLDLQSSGVTPSGTYAFLFSGAAGTSAFATAGNFTVGSGGTITAGLEDFNTAGVPYTNSGAGYTVSGSVVAVSSSTPATTLTTGSTYGTLTFDVYPISSTQLKFIETDTVATLSGDAFAEPSATVPTGTLPFTLSGLLTGDEPFAAGGFIVTDGAGDITSTSSEDFNEGGVTFSSATAPATFTGSYTGGTGGRFLLTNLSGNGFVGGTEYVAYPSSAGLFLLEVDDTLGIEAGVAYPPQSAGATFAASEGYGLNLSGTNISGESEGEGPVEVDDIAEFSAGTSGNLVGIIDENSTASGGGSTSSLSDGTYSAISAGRYAVSAADGTIAGGFGLILYTVDGVTFPFMESGSDDTGQISTGVVVEQNASGVSPATAKSHLFVAPRLVQPHATHPGESLKRK
jgi:hypothetical protein